MPPQDIFVTTDVISGCESNDNLDLILHGAKRDEGEQDFDEDEALPLEPPTITISGYLLRTVGNVVGDNNENISVGSNPEPEPEPQEEANTGNGSTSVIDNGNRNAEAEDEDEAASSYRSWSSRGGDDRSFRDGDSAGADRSFVSGERGGVGSVGEDGYQDSQRSWSSRGGDVDSRVEGDAEDRSTSILSYDRRSNVSMSHRSGSARSGSQSNQA